MYIARRAEASEQHPQTAHQPLVLLPPLVLVTVPVPLPLGSLQQPRRVEGRLAAKKPSPQPGQVVEAAGAFVESKEQIGDVKLIPYRPVQGRVVRRQNVVGEGFEFPFEEAPEAVVVEFTLGV